MSSTRDADDRIQAWLQKELDLVPEPGRAVQEAIRASSSVAQRAPRRGLRGWLAERRRATVVAPLPQEPEVVLYADAPRPGAAPSANAAPRPHGLPVALGVMAVAVAVVLPVALFLGYGGLGSAPGPASQPLPAALSVGDPTADGRDIVVAADGSGHFWTIGDAVAEAVDGDRITVMPGTYEDSILVPGKDISISGQGGAGAVVLRPSTGPQDMPDGYTSLSDFVPEGSEALDPQELSDDWRYVFYLKDSEARISGLSILGSIVGSAVVVDGGAPVLSDLVVDPDGTQNDGDPLAPRESMTAFGGSRATLQNSTITGVVSIRDGSQASLLDNTFEGTCIIVSGAGTDALVMGNHIQSSVNSGQCPRFNIAVIKGASPVIDANTIVGDQRTDGIRVLGPDTAPTIQGNNVAGADSGIWIGGEARGLITRNNVTDARAGIKIVGASPSVLINGFFRSEVGASIDSDSMPEFRDNEICENVENLALGEGATIALDLNPDICADSSTAALAAR